MWSKVLDFVLGLKAQYVIAAVIISMLGAGILMYTKAKAEADRYRQEAGLRLQQLIALQDSMRVQEAYSDSLEERVVVVLTNYPNVDSLRNLIRKETLEQIEQEGGVLTGGTEVISQAASDTLNGGVTGTATAAETIPEQLDYRIDEETWITDIGIDLQVYPYLNEMRYQIQLNYKPATTRFYTVEKTVEGLPIIEVWADVPGQPIMMRSFSRPTKIEFRDRPSAQARRTSFYTAGRVFTLADKVEAGIELGMQNQRGPLFAEYSLGYGIIEQRVFAGLRVGIRF